MPPFDPIRLIDAPTRREPPRLSARVWGGRAAWHWTVADRTTGAVVAEGHDTNLQRATRQAVVARAEHETRRT